MKPCCLVLVALLVSGLSAQTRAASETSRRVSTGPQIKEIFQFTRPGGFYPRGALILDQAGNLYGTASVGGNTGCGGNGCGTVFKLSRNPTGAWSESVLYTFTGGNDGANPVGPLIFDTKGNLYGTAWGGGSPNCSGGCGTVFMLTPQGPNWSETTICEFQGLTDGWAPKANLVFDKAGNLYGTTTSGGASLFWGTVFKLTRQQDGNWRETVLHSFDEGPGGCVPYGVVVDPQDNIYGIAELCGARVSWGTVWEISNSGIFSVVHTFEDNGTDGQMPNVGLTIDHAGNLYGATVAGPNLLCGGSGCGVVYMLSANLNWRETILYTFSGNPGAVPHGDLSFDAAGNLYGTTQFWDEGTLFVLHPSSHGVTFRDIHDFTGPQGPPFAGVVFDSSGHAYGTQTTAGSSLGGVFEMIP